MHTTRRTSWPSTARVDITTSQFAATLLSQLNEAHERVTYKFTDIGTSITVLYLPEYAALRCQVSSLPSDYITSTLRDVASSKKLTFEGFVIKGV